MTVEQAIEAAELIEKMKRLDGALGYIETFEKKVAGRLPSCCRLEIGGLILIDGIPKEITLEMMEHLKNVLKQSDSRSPQSWRRCNGGRLISAF